MQKKTAIIIGCVLGVIVTALILCWTLFGLSIVEVNFKGETITFASEESKTQIIQSGKFKMHNCILFYQKDEAVKNLEKLNPYLEVINIETVFPNKFVIHCLEREEIYAIEYATKKFAICDENLKVLKINDFSSLDGTTYESTQSNAILLKGLSITNQSVEVGDFLTPSSFPKLFANVFIALERNNRTNVEQKALINDFVLYEKPNGEIELRLNMFDGVLVKIDDPNDLLIYKFQTMFAALTQVTDPTNTQLYIYKFNEDIQCNIGAK